jgi:hypothetical protein
LAIASRPRRYSRPRQHFTASSRFALSFFIEPDRCTDQSLCPSAMVVFGLFLCEFSGDANTFQGCCSTYHRPDHRNADAFEHNLLVPRFMAYPKIVPAHCGRHFVAKSRTATHRADLYSMSAFAVKSGLKAAYWPASSGFLLVVGRYRKTMPMLKGSPRSR